LPYPEAWSDRLLAMGNQGSGCCEAPNGERRVRVEDGAGNAAYSMAPTTTEGNVDEQPLELLTYLYALSLQVNDAVSPYRPVRLASDVNHAGPFGSPRCLRGRDPVVQSLCEAFQRCSSSKKTPGGSNSTSKRLASHLARDTSSAGRRLNMVTEVSRDLSSDAEPSEPAPDVPRRNLLAHLSAASDPSDQAADGWPVGDSTRCQDSSASNAYYEEGGAKREGFGVLTWPDGRRYEGEFKNGMFDGHACMTWPDGRSYTGQYQANKKHGVGVFSWPDGRRYSGHWHQGRREGRGMYTNAKGEMRHGYWENDRPLEWDPPTICPKSSQKDGEATKQVSAQAPRAKARVGGA